MIVVGRTLALMAALLAAPGIATTIFPQDFTCPVGGEKFSGTSVGSYTTWGRFPDGQDVGSGPFPLPLTECPANGLVMYKEFEKAEVTALTLLVAESAYQALRKADTQRYRAFWLAKALGDPDAVWLLLSATHEAKNSRNDGLIARYQAEFIEMAKLRALEPKDFASIALKARTANALRELSRFEEALSMLKSITVADDAGGNDPEAASNRSGWRSFLKMLAVVVARRDSRRGPLDMIGEREAAFACAAPDVARFRDNFPPLTAFDREFCKQPQVAKITAQIVAANKGK